MSGKQKLNNQRKPVWLHVAFFLCVADGGKCTAPRPRRNYARVRTKETTQRTNQAGQERTDGRTDEEKDAEAEEQQEREREMGKENRRTEEGGTNPDGIQRMKAFCLLVSLLWMMMMSLRGNENKNPREDGRTDGRTDDEGRKEGGATIEDHACMHAAAGRERKMEKWNGEMEKKRKKKKEESWLSEEFHSFILSCLLACLLACLLVMVVFPLASLGGSGIALSSILEGVVRCSAKRNSLIAL
jgi:Flp pilus assembly protein TadB